MKHQESWQERHDRLERELDKKLNRQMIPLMLPLAIAAGALVGLLVNQLIFVPLPHELMGLFMLLWAIVGFAPIGLMAWKYR